MYPVYSINELSKLSPLTVLWYQILLSPYCPCIHFQVWIYFTWPHFFYTEGGFAWDILYIYIMHTCTQMLCTLRVARVFWCWPVLLSKDLSQKYHRWSGRHSTRSPIAPHHQMLFQRNIPHSSNLDEFCNRRIKHVNSIITYVCMNVHNVCIV